MKSPSPQCAILLEQSRARWDQLLILLGLLVAERAESLSSARGPYALKAAIAACHARARTAAAADWQLDSALPG